MKKTLAILSVLAFTMMSMSTAYAACGSNTNRNSLTRAPGTSSGSNGGSSSSGTASGAGMDRGSSLPN